MGHNLLINEKSLYLKQHSTNPVDWYPWSIEAFEKAKSENKPIFLSIGYSSCHWCHVMERESFEDMNTAKIMNDKFVNIKVDREERPDIDSVYMDVVQKITGSGGWPLSVFMNSNGEPFFGGTYFPPVSRHGLPSFITILQQISDSYHTKQDDVAQITKDILSNIETSLFSISDVLNDDAIKNSYSKITEIFDSVNGGFNGSPKFPQSPVLDFLITIQNDTDYSFSSTMLEHTLKKMYHVGIYEHIGGAFHRYSTDSQWMVPHFEKMLYENALLSNVYTKLYRITKLDFYRNISEEILDYIILEMSSSDGGFYSTQDADSEYIEGKYYVWSKIEIEDILGQTDSKLFCDYYGVSDGGNFEGQNILHIPSPIDYVSASTQSSSPKNDQIIQRAKLKLKNYREKRINPTTDQKIITSWNGLMLASFADAARFFKNNTYQKIAEANANFILSKIRNDNTLPHICGNGDIEINGYLEDYAFVSYGLIKLYQTTFDANLINLALNFADKIITDFQDDSTGGFYDTSKDHEKLITRSKNIFDSSVPSAGSISTYILLQLYHYTGEQRFLSAAVNALKSIFLILYKSPTHFGSWLSALYHYSHPPKELVIIGDHNSNEVINMLKIVDENSFNDIIIAVQSETEDNSNIIPLFKGRSQINEKPTAYVCDNFICKNPTNDPKVLRQLLNNSS